MTTVALSELCEINVGRTPARADPSLWGAGQPWLSIADMKQGQLVTTTKEQITAAGAKGGTQVKPGTVLLSFKLSIGKVAIAGMPLYTNEAIAALPVRDQKVLDERFLLRALEAMDLSADSNRAAMGATLNKAKLQGVQVPVPSLDEQRRIVTILDQADALRAKRRQVIAHLDCITQSIFRELFEGRHDPFHRLDSLIDAGDRMNYGVVQPGDDTPGGVPLIRVSNLVGGAVDRSDLKHISHEIEASYGRSRIKGNEILVSCVGSIGSVSVVRSADVGSNIARAITRVPISDPITRTYVAAFLRTVDAQRYFVSELRTVAQPTLNVGQLAATGTPMPPVSLQRELAIGLEGVGAYRVLAERALAADDELFTSLQTRAFGDKL